MDGFQRALSRVQQAITVIQSEAERIRVPIQSARSSSAIRSLRRLLQAIADLEFEIDCLRNSYPRETGGISRRIITESIETHENRPRPACPRSVEKLLQKVEIGNIPEGQCSICLDDYDVEREVCVIVRCSHAFHEACIMKWLEENHVCPLCRFTFDAKKN